MTSDFYIFVAALVFVVNMLAVYFVHGFWRDRQVTKKERLTDDVKLWNDIGWRREPFVAVLRDEWRWVGRMDPWMEKPWTGTKYEAYWEEIYVVQGRR